MPLSVYREYFLDPPPMVKARAQQAPLSTNTLGYMECVIAMELKMLPEDYRKLPRRQRKELLFFHVLKGVKEQWAYEQSKEESERNATLEAKPAPSRLRG